MNTILITSTDSDIREHIYVNEEDIEDLKPLLTEKDTIRQVSQEEFDDYLAQANAQKEKLKLERQFKNYAKHLDDIGVYDYGVPNPFRKPIPTKEVVMTGFTQVKGRKHLSKKKRKQLKLK